MKISTSNPHECRALANDPDFVSVELMPGAENGHKFKPGDVCTLHGLVDFPEFNGQSVTISSIREDGPKGRAYYIRGRMDQTINWVYEYRLKPGGRVTETAVEIAP